MDRTPEGAVAVIAGAVDLAARAAGLRLASVKSVGVGVAGQCLARTGVILNAPNLGWRDVAFGDLLSKALRKPVRIANDLSAAAWGERSFGAAKGIDDVVLVFVGSGVGSALILDGRLYGGATGVAAEFGHIKVRPRRSSTKPRQCGCGEMNCLEAFTSGMNVAARVREDLGLGTPTRVLGLAGGDPARVSASLVDLAFHDGDPYARELWEEVSELLGVATANLVTVLNPARLILGGGVLGGAPNLTKLVRGRIEEAVSRSAFRSLSVEHAWLGDDAGVIGAALLDH